MTAEPPRVPPPVELAAQVAARSGCTEVISIGPVPVGLPRTVLEVLTSEVPAPALAQPTWLRRRARSAVVVLDVDAVAAAASEELGGDEPWRSATAVLREAPVVVLVGGRAEDGARLLEGTGLDAVFTGTHGRGPGAGRRVAVCEPPSGPSRVPVPPPPADFRVTAFVTVFNEDDVLAGVLDDLVAQGVDAFVLDNWSTDDSWDIARSRIGSGVVAVERWPSSGPAEHFDLRENLELISRRSAGLGPGWSIKHDADEIRRPPWPGVTMRDALWRVECTGYNVVDFTVLNYRPTTDGYRPGSDLWREMPYFEFGDKPGHFRQLKAWRTFGQDVDYARFASHRIAFAGMRVFPYKFELHHYPVRSQEHGRRKVLTERIGRYLPAARARGWHTHYDDVDAATDFVVDESSLMRRSEEVWAAHRVELLSGAGLPRGPRDARPA